MNRRSPTALMSLAGTALVVVGCACGPSHLTREQLLDPATCGTCHPNQFLEWSGSMHAYASDDPVFRAMNARGQRETGGQLGSFCVQCHAPMAVRENATIDGTNLDAVDSKLHGVTCFFCHSVDAVDGTHNDPLHLAADFTMRGEYSDPVPNSAHPSIYSSLIDRDQFSSAGLCGSCHDIVVPHDLATDPQASNCVVGDAGAGTPCGPSIERTFTEWRGSAFASAEGQTCSNCHMVDSHLNEPIAVRTSLESTSSSGLPTRISHRHHFPAVDVALTPGFPQAALLLQNTQDFLNTIFQGALCVSEVGGSSPSQIRVILDNVAAAHDVPSGAGQDRRLWVEVVASQNGSVIYQSGVVPAGSAVTSISDPDLWLIRDCLLTSQGAGTHNFWEAASDESNAIPVQTTFNKLDPAFYNTHIIQNYPRDPSKFFNGQPDHVTMRVLFQPIGYDVVDDLIGCGDLSAAVRSSMPTFVLGYQPALVWSLGDPTLVPHVDPNTGLAFQCAVSGSNFNPNATNNPAVNHAACSP